MIGGFGIALAEVMTSTYVSSGAGEAVPFIVLILVLAIKPTGMFAQVAQR